MPVEESQEIVTSSMYPATGSRLWYLDLVYLCGLIKFNDRLFARSQGSEHRTLGLLVLSGDGRYISAIGGGGATMISPMRVRSFS